MAQLEDKLSAAGFTVKALKDSTRVVPEATAFGPDLVLMDRILPVLTGAETIRGLRAFPKTRNIPVAFALSLGSENEILRSLQAGAVDVLKKPMAPAHVPRIASLVEELTAHPPDPLGPSHLRTTENLLALYRRDKRHGTLHVNAGTPFEGRAKFVEGELVEAEYGPLSGREALEEMVQIEDGIWRFQIAGAPLPSLQPLRPSAEPQVDPDAPTPLPMRPSVQRPKSEPYRPRILVVDDAPPLRRLFSTQLEKVGVKTDQAEDGEVAHRKACAQPFDLILSDLHMPKVDGWGLLQRLKADQRTREVPVVFLSAHDDYRETLKMARAGAHDYLAKTGRAEDVISRVMAILAPRLEFQVVIESGLAVGGIQLAQLGPQWLLRALARSKVTGTLHLTEEWGEYHLAVENGEPVVAKARSASREVTGMAAVASLIVSRNAEGNFNPGPAPTGPRFGQPMEMLLDRACEILNQLDANVVGARIAQGAPVELDPMLYDLFRQVATDRQVRLARALCEEKVPFAQLGASLGLSPEQVVEGITELLHRGVLRFASSK